MEMKTNHFVNPLWTSDAIWRHSSGSTLVQVMACCHRANVDSSSVSSFGIHYTTMSQEIHKINVLDISLRIIGLRLLPNLLAANNLDYQYSPMIRLYISFSCLIS